VVKTHVPLIQRIIGLGLIITGFVFITIILNPKGLAGPSISDRIAWLLILYTVGAMISLGGYLAAGYAPIRGLEILIVSGLWVLLILPIFYLPISEDTFVLALGFSPFLALLLWIAYAKLKEKITGKRETDKW
jgi:hypothetical protein